MSSFDYKTSSISADCLLSFRRRCLVVHSKRDQLIARFSIKTIVMIYNNRFSFLVMMSDSLWDLFYCHLIVMGYVKKVDPDRGQFSRIDHSLINIWSSVWCSSIARRIFKEIQNEVDRRDLANLHHCQLPVIYHFPSHRNPINNKNRLLL